jgi:hypothetical protein
MRSENAELRSKVAALEGSGIRRTRQSGELESESTGSAGQVSRRWLLSKAGAAAVGSVAAGTLMLRDTRQAKADHYANSITADSILTHALFADADVPRGSTNSLNALSGETTSDDWAAVRGENFGAGSGVVGLSAAGAGVYGESDTNDRGAVEGSNTGTSGYGVWGNSNGIGVYGSGQQNGVKGTSSTTESAAVHGEHKGVGTGVLGTGKPGVHGIGTGTAAPGVLGENANAVGVAGNGKIGISGQSSAAGFPAVYGQHTGTAVGYGVRGTSNSGYGGFFQGGKAQLRLVPGSTVGKPTSGAHTKGEIYMDSTGTLFVCTASATPGTWKKVTTTAV